MGNEFEGRVPLETVIVEGILSYWEFYCTGFSVAVAIHYLDCRWRFQKLVGNAHPTGNCAKNQVGVGLGLTFRQNFFVCAVSRHNLSFAQDIKMAGIRMRRRKRASGKRHVV